MTKRDAPHGTVARYKLGCRRFCCRLANANYARERAAAIRRGDWNGLIDVEPIRAHLSKLREQGLGVRQVADIAGLNVTSLRRVRQGKSRRMRADTVARVLAVRAEPQVLADGQCIDARPTKKLIDKLLDGGYTKTWIADQLGMKGHRLQVYDRITVRNAARIERLYRDIDAGKVRRA